VSTENRFDDNYYTMIINITQRGILHCRSDDDIANQLPCIILSNRRVYCLLRFFIVGVQCVTYYNIILNVYVSFHIKQKIGCNCGFIAKVVFFPHNDFQIRVYDALARNSDRFTADGCVRHSGDRALTLSA